jgi:hypothetical protein
LEIANLSKEVDEVSLKESLKRAIDRLSALSSPLLSELGVENPLDPIRLSPDDLTLKVQRREREDLLSEIGSGSNWLGYHLAIAFGLQRLIRPDMALRLWQLDIERVDFMDADVAREERDAVWSESAPLSHYDAVEARDALQTEKRFRTGGANSDATKCWVG